MPGSPFSRIGCKGMLNKGINADVVVIGGGAVERPPDTIFPREDWMSCLSIAAALLAVPPEDATATFLWPIRCPAMIAS